MAKKKKSAGGLGADVDNDDEKGGGFAGFLLAEIGRASCRERV